MTEVDGLGYLAATLVLATFTAKNMVALRVLAISSNLAFIAYGLLAGLWPILLLHSIMLPLNLIRLREALGETPAFTSADRVAACSNYWEGACGGLCRVAADRLSVHAARGSTGNLPSSTAWQATSVPSASISSGRSPRQRSLAKGQRG